MFRAFDSSRYANKGAAAPDKVGDTMAKAVSYIEKHLNIIVMCASIFSMMVGFYTSAQAQQNMKTNEKIGLEHRLTELEIKMRLLLKHFNIEDTSRK